MTKFNSDNAHLNKLKLMNITKQVNNLMKNNKSFVNDLCLLLVKYGVKL